MGQIFTNNILVKGLKKFYCLQNLRFRIFLKFLTPPSRFSKLLICTVNFLVKEDVIKGQDFIVISSQMIDFVTNG